MAIKENWEKVEKRWIYLFWPIQNFPQGAQIMHVMFSVSFLGVRLSILAYSLRSIGNLT